MPPRRRHLAVVTGDALAVRPYAQLLNTSAWLLYEADVDPATSDPELLAWLLALGDRMAATGEVTLAAVQTAAWWLERSDAECAAFAAAARRSTRPDADAVRATADAVPWLRRLAHETLRPPALLGAHRPVPGTGLLVPAHLETEPPALVARWTTVARSTVAAFQGRWRVRDPAVTAALLDWLAGDAPPLLVVGERGRIVWDPATPDRLGPLRAVLRDADAAAVAAVRNDLDAVARVTRDFRAAVVEPSALPASAAGALQRGYGYLHAARGLVAYNLHEPGMERLHGPPLPYARAMVAARAAHEWAHLADTAGLAVHARARGVTPAAPRWPTPSTRPSPRRRRRCTARPPRTWRRWAATERPAPRWPRSRCAACRTGARTSSLARCSTRPSARPTCGTTCACCAPSIRRPRSGACSCATSSSSSTCARRSG
ncbi:MAG: hypothetical protein KIT14_12275 [bacterium]|nr:hypothetical protein [bacterium]